MSWVSPLDPREAFYGGRTGIAKCYHAVESGEEIYYQDLTSLYPTINKYGTYLKVIHKSWSIQRVKTLMITLV